ncbi:MAG: pyruvate kinase [Anaerolineales bacterium]
MERRAKIVATIGPTSEEEETLEKLFKAGMNVARLNFSHGTHEDHAKRIQRIRQVAEKLEISAGIMLDMQGPKLRVGVLPQPLALSFDEPVRVYWQDDPLPVGEEQKIPVTFPELFESIRAGDRMLLDDGRLVLVVGSVKGRVIQARVVVGGVLSSNKGINLPGVRLRIPAFTEKDEADLAFGLQQGIEAIAISFVRSVQDIIQVRHAIKRLLPANQPRPLVIAKLERPEALDDLDDILDAVDGVMVARGDLGVEMPPERVPVIQKRIISAANAKAKLVITATQMLESMIINPLPTRAEASDVANAIFDGTDAIMLSGETAAGKYPVEAVAMMDRIAREAESHFLDWGQSYQNAQDGLGDTDAAAMARAAYAIARDRDVAGITVFTIHGSTAWLMSKVRAQVPIIAFTSNENTYRQMSFLWGICPRCLDFVETLELMIERVDSALLETTNFRPGDQVVIICGFPVGALRNPNMALLHTIGE